MTLLHDGLLEHARRLCARDNPTEADFRRAVSAAYYAAFHLLIAEATRIVAPVSPPGLAVNIGRSIEHRTMRTVCEGFSGEQIPWAPVRGLIALPLHESLKRLARRFRELQDQRLAADYDPACSVDTFWARTQLTTAEEVFADWSIVKGSANANVFLTALVFPRLWGRGA